uniref:gamma-glutamylcyclotransferase n=1 Tax=Rhipicephalus zambeziensis TaxID=60191 RepID=A0A224Y604_9ACAR
MCHPLSLRCQLRGLFFRSPGHLGRALKYDGLLATSAASPRTHVTTQASMGTSSSAGKSRSPGDILYFAYGSNMWSHRVHIRNPTAKFFDIAELEGYYVDFVDDFESWQGAAAILKKSAERTTHGVIWTIPKRDLHNLDQQESDYEAANVTVKLPSGDKVDCRTYFYLTSRPGKKNMPSLLYKAVIVAGAIEHKLPDSYVQELVKIPDNGKTQNSNIGVDIDKLRSYVNGYLSL